MKSGQVRMSIFVGNASRGGITDFEGGIDNGKSKGRFRRQEKT